MPFLSLSLTARKRDITSNMYIFMLLGQAVAISFAMSLSFLLFSINRPSPSSTKTATPMEKLRTTSISTSADSRTIAEAQVAPSPVLMTVSAASQYLLLGLVLMLALAAPHHLNDSRFMWLLMTPHILAFLPLFTSHYATTLKRSDELPWHVAAAVMTVILAVTSSAVFRQGGDLERIAEAFREHPAVSSVGWDVVFCWLTMMFWYLLGRD